MNIDPKILELLALPKEQLNKELIRAASDRARRLLWMDVASLCRRLLKDEPDQETERLPPPMPGPMQARFSPGKDSSMIECTVTLPVAPDPATLDPDKVPVSQQFSASVAGASVFAKEYPMDAATADPFEVDYDVDVDLSLTYTDVDGQVSAPKTQTFRSPAKAKPVVNLPPDAPGDFGEIKMRDVAAAVVPTPAPVEPAAEVPVEPAAEEAAPAPAEEAAAPAEEPAAPADDAPAAEPTEETK